jgi:large subunit ribosomal protein L23
MLHEPQNKYFFLVKNSANRIQVKEAIEQLYKVKVRSVNIMVSSGKLKRLRHQLGRTPDLKKAIVTLKDGQKIESI